MSLTPADLCRGLLGALEASEGRRKRRARNTTADSIGLAIQQEMLEAAVREQPSPDEFEGWLWRQCMADGTADGPRRAMALTIWDQWQLARHVSDVESWIAGGGRSDDRDSGATL